MGVMHVRSVMFGMNVMNVNVMNVTARPSSVEENLEKNLYTGRLQVLLMYLKQQTLISGLRRGHGRPEGQRCIRGH